MYGFLFIVLLSELVLRTYYYPPRARLPTTLPSPAPTVLPLCLGCPNLPPFAIPPLSLAPWHRAGTQINAAGGPTANPELTEGAIGREKGRIHWA